MMNSFKGKPIVSGKGTGPAVVTDKPINFTAALLKSANIIFRDRLSDKHHELYRTRLKGKVLVFPACVGSTFTGQVLLELAVNKCAPAALIVQKADPLLASGPLMAEVWYGLGIPLVEYSGGDLYATLKKGVRVTVDGSTGMITVE